MLLRSLVVSATIAALPFFPHHAADLPAQTLPVFGGSGGNSFSRSCGSGKVLTGIQYRASRLVDAVLVLCRPVGSDGKLGSQSAIGDYAGGGGGTQGVAQCGSGSVVTGAKIRHGWFVDGITLVCRSWNASQRRFETNAKFPPTTVLFGSSSGGSVSSENCEAQSQPVRAIRGRAASFVDAFGLTCDEP